MSVSRIFGILALLASALTTAASFLGAIKPQWAIYAVAIAGAINAFTERVHGGTSVAK